MLIISKGIQQNFISLLKNSLEKLNKNRMSAELSQDRNNSAQIAENQFSAVYVTTPNEEVAKTIAQGLVRRKIAACVNIIPKITSIYEWEGQINEDSEVLMMIKTKSSKFEELTEFVKKNHPYTVCEVIAVPILQGNPDYLKWIDKTSIPEAENFNKLHKEKVDLKNLQMP